MHRYFTTEKKTLARGTLKIVPQKKKCAEVIFIHNGHFWEMSKENETFL